MRKTACAAIADIVKWSPDLATSFLGTSPSPLPMLAAFLRSPSPPLRTQSLSLLTHIAKHPLLAEKTVLSTGVAKAAVVSLHPSRGGRERWAGVCWCAEIARGGAELARLLVDAGAAPLLVQFAAEPPEVILSPPADPAVPAIATLGHIAGYSALLAHACVAAGSTPAFSQILQAGSPAAKESAAWSLAQACKWSAAHAADALPVLPTLLRLSFPDGHRFLRAFNKLLKAVEDPGALISCILALPSPDPASQAAALSILARFLPILATSLAARKEMVRRGALGKVLEYDAAIEGSAEWKTAVDAVRRCFPEEVVR